MGNRFAPDELGSEMVRFTDVAKQVSTKMRRRLNDAPLLNPLGRTADSKIDEALATRRLERADLFKRRSTFAPHRHRIAALLAVHDLSPTQLVARHWPELKGADHLCAHCVDQIRCDRWLRGWHENDTPRRFCPNATTFEQWRHDCHRHQHDVAGKRINARSNSKISSKGEKKCARSISAYSE